MELMVIGQVLKPQGIKGQLKVKPLLADVDYFFDFEKVYILGQEYTISNVREHEGFIYLDLEEITNMDMAEQLRDKMIEIERDKLPQLQQGQYYVSDLEDCSLYFEDGEKVGRINSVENYGATDILNIRSGTEEILCPFVPDIFEDVDISNKRIILNKKRFLEVTQSED